MSNINTRIENIRKGIEKRASAMKAKGENMEIKVGCDFVEDTEREPYCCLNHCVCNPESYDILKYGVGKEDIEHCWQAMWEIMYQHL